MVDTGLIIALWHWSMFCSFVHFFFKEMLSIFVTSVLCVAISSFGYFFKTYYLYVWGGWRMLVHVNAFEGQKRISFPEVGLTYGCEPPDMGAQKQECPLQEQFFDFRVISSASFPFFRIAVSRSFTLPKSYICHQFIYLKKETSCVVVVVCAFNPSIQVTEAGGFPSSRPV